MPPRRNPGLFHFLKEQVGRQVNYAVKRQMFNAIARNAMEKRKIEQTQRYNNFSLKTALEIQNGFRIYHRLPRTKQAELDAMLSRQMEEVGVSREEAVKLRNMKLLETQQNVSRTIEGLRARFKTLKVNEQAVLARKISFLERKGIPRELAQQIALMWIEMLKGNIKSSEAFKRMIKIDGRTGQIFFEIQGQKIPANHFLGKTEQIFVKEYGRELFRAETNKGKGIKEISLKEASGR